jgi:putative peptidoglycan lipid II flippase
MANVLSLFSPPLSDLFKTALALAAVSAVSKLLGLVRESSLAYYFGAGPETDAYKLALGMPNLLLSVIASSLAVTFIPVYTGYLKNKSTGEGNYFLNNIMNMTGLMCIMLTIPGMIFAGPLVRMMAPGFEGNTWRLAAALMFIIMPSLIFISLSNLSTSFLQTHGSFLPGMFIWIPYNLIIIASTVAYSGKNIRTVAVGSFVAAACMFLFQLPYMVRKGFRYRPVLDFREEGFKRLLFLMLPVFIGGVFDQLYIVIYRVLASGFDVEASRRLTLQIG